MNFWFAYSHGQLAARKKKQETQNTKQETRKMEPETLKPPKEYFA